MDKERKRHNELVAEAKEKNNDRTEEEKKIFWGESRGGMSEEMVYKREGGGSRESSMGVKNMRLKMMYTNIDRVTLNRLEVEDYMKEMKPAIVCLAEKKN